MGIKVAVGKLPLPESVDSYISGRMAHLGVRSLEITASHALRASALPLHRRDPAIVLRCKISNDRPQIRQAPIRFGECC